MENQSFYLSGIRRMLDFPLKIETIGLRPQNTWVHRQNRVNQYFLCFVLKMDPPDVIMKINGKEEHITHAPRMGLVEPGTLLETVDPNCREEIFFIYPASAKEQLERLHINSCYFELTPAFNDTLHRIKSNLFRLQCPGVADRLDYLAVELAQEAMLAALENNGKQTEMPDERIFIIANYFQIHFGERIYLEELLKKHGLTRRTFYREWKKHYTISPAQFLIDLRMKYACDLLVNSQKKIYEIASDTGFCDAMYFSHIFTQHIGCTPNEYRKQNLSQSW